MASYKELIVWQRSIDLVVAVYRATEGLPIGERYALCDQMRRAVVSIPSNIAEGHARETKKEFRHFLLIASGSLAELETQLIVCERVGFLSSVVIHMLLEKIEEIRKMIVGLSKTLL